MNKRGILFGLLAVAFSIVAVLWQLWSQLPAGVNAGIDMSIFYATPRFWAFAGLLFLTVYMIDTILFHRHAE
jgi:hypothetical protein